MLLAKMLLAMLLASAYLSSAAAEVLRLDYEGFTIWLDCERRGAVKFRYNAQRDQGDGDGAPSRRRFNLSRQQRDCQQQKDLKRRLAPEVQVDRERHVRGDNQH